MTKKFDRNKKLLEAIETEINVRPADDTDLEHTQDVAAYEKINALYETHVVTLARGPLGADALGGMNDTLQALERFWSDEIRYGGSR